MAPDIHADPFFPSRVEPLPEHELETAWFRDARRSSRPPSSVPARASAPPPPPPIDDPLADRWFR